MIFRNAERIETQTILDLYSCVKGLSFCNWNEQYPGIQEISHDIETSNLFVMIHNSQIIGAISIVPENELDYKLCWSVRKETNEIARVVIHPDYQGKGYSKQLVLNVLEKLRERGCRGVHLAVAAANIPARKTYSQIGFITVDECDMYDDHYFLCEKAL